jgi:tetratricopeptide (TPR) repeat protein
MDKIFSAASGSENPGKRRPFLEITGGMLLLGIGLAVFHAQVNRQAGETFSPSAGALYDMQSGMEQRAVECNNRGNEAQAKKEYDRAVAEYSEAILLYPGEAVFLGNRGNAYFDKQEYGKAIADYTEAIRMNPGEAKFYNSRGNARLGKQDYNDAAADYSEAIRLIPDEADFRVSRGNAYFYLKDYNRAIADYESALRINPAHATAKNNLKVAKETREYAYTPASAR